MSPTPWLAHAPDPAADVHLLCFPHSGAPASLFQGWRIPGVDVLPVLLPGRGPRRHEPLVRSLDALAEAVADDVVPRLTGRYCLLGHSMGAWLAHAVAALLDQRHGTGPERLFVLSAPPPHLPPSPFSSQSGLSDDAMLDELVRVGGAPESAREAVRANLGAIRADVTAVGGYRPDAHPLSCPITAIGGSRDLLFDTGTLVEWRAATRSGCSVHFVDAGHFTVTEQPDAVLRITARDLGRTAPPADPVAVIGMACRLPGAGHPAAFWALLRSGRSAVGPVPPDRIGGNGHRIMHAGGFLDAVDAFDAGHFGFSTREAHRADPRLRLLLMTVQEAIDDAGLTADGVAGPRTGIWVGESHSDYWDLSTAAVPPNMYTLSGGGLKSFLSGRVSHFFDLQGPSITLDTSCSASLTAIHAACRALRGGEVDTAFAAGAHLILNPDGGPSHGLAKALSPNGRSAFADAGADGYARAEGVAVVLLRRLADALRDGDPVHAVIEGSAVNANGRSGRNIVSTSGPGQVRMMREALADAGRLPADIAYVEAHGPGTRVGDDIELAALHEVYGGNPGPCLVGSVKTNIGHLEPVAGIAGFLKTVLALEHGRVPASLHHRDPAPAIDWDRSALRVPTACEPWPVDGPRCAAVSSFGLSGANAHAVVAAPPGQTAQRRRLPRRTWNTRRYWYTALVDGDRDRDGDGNGARPDRDAPPGPPAAPTRPAPLPAPRGGDPVTPHPFFRDRMPVWAELDELLGAPDFAQDLAGVGATYRRLQAFGRRLGPARDLHGDPLRLLAGMEWAGMVDPAMMHAAMVHYGVAATSLVECGHPGDDLDALAAGLDTMDAPGTIVVTELGRGGSQINVRTEARYDRDRRTFTLCTPDDAAVKIMPNVGWPGLARTAVVIARLVVDGADNGVHAFAFRFPHPRAEVMSLPGGAPVALDYSAIRFNDAEIPHGHWLSGTAAITGNGVADPLGPQQRLARSLGGVQSAAVFAAVALASAARATVAVAFRYTSQRVVGGPGTPVLDFATHRDDLAPAVARVYATGAYVEKVRRDFADERLGRGAPRTGPAVEGAAYAPWLAADRDRTLAKTAAATALESVAATCRRLCGFQGVLRTNRITVYEDMAKSFHSAGGDTRLLLLEAGKQLLSGGDAPAVPGAVGPGTGDASSTLRLVALHEHVLTGTLRDLVGAGDPGPHLRRIEDLARVHLTRRILEEFDEAVAAASGPWRDMLGAARRLYGLDAVLDTAAWHFDHGSLRPGDGDILRSARADAVDEVVRRLGGLVDGLAVPPGRVGGFIGREDYIGRFAALVPGNDR
ncbi:beta-ketoacyl synthase N-terminal-like domain-containing protein [Nocardiopsis sediminis]|uniref:Beta-ketoacyl synthase N-terminal-like domain-containing protein n=1 Tax=Nocardiopsis sediminis TaxID=1778267 RepID=A0ABV8FFY1_9ACTN